MSAIRIEKGSLVVPINPVIPYIMGDGIGRDITPVMIRVIDTAVEKAYGGVRRIKWLRVFAGDDALQEAGYTLDETLKLPEKERQRIYLPTATIDALRLYKVSI